MHRADLSLGTNRSTPVPTHYSGRKPPSRGFFITRAVGHRVEVSAPFFLLFFVFVLLNMQDSCACVVRDQFEPAL